MAIENFDYLSFIEHQLSVWPEAKQNYDHLKNAKRRRITIGDFEMGIQYNAGRIKSTGADVSKDSINKRPCFLCKSNRPKQQIAITDIVPDFEILLNPYPIFPVHLTISSIFHRPQREIPLGMIDLVSAAPELATFYNGAHAGASAPDHLHFQATLKCELPIIKRIETKHSDSGTPFLLSQDCDPTFPFEYKSLIIDKNTPTPALYLRAFQLAANAQESGLENALIWIDPLGRLRAVSIKRIAHRPACFSESDPEKQIMISPGAVDMAGLIITPREEDFYKITPLDILTVYSQTACPNQ